MKQLFIVFMLVNLFSGCHSASKSMHSILLPSKHRTTEVDNALYKCDINKVIDIVKENQSNFLRMVELGLLQFYQGKYKESQKYFLEAIKIYNEFENKPLVSISDYVIANYDVEGYDKVLLRNYNALNYLMMGNVEESKVEARNSNFIQKHQREEFYFEIEKYKNRQNEYKFIFNRYEKLFNNVNPKHNPYQNPFAYYISALIYEENGDYQEAYKDIEKALDYYSDSEILKEKLHFYSLDKSPKETSHVELFFDIGKSPIKVQDKISVVVEDKKKMIYLPTFELYISEIDKIIIIDSTNNIIAKSSILADINAMKINEFKEKLPSLVNKIMLESAKEGVSGALSKVSTLGVGVFNTLNVIYSQNNLLTWSMLPQRIDVISFEPRKDEIYELKAIDKDGNILDKKKIKLNCTSKLKNCYQSYVFKNDKFCNIKKD